MKTRYMLLAAVVLLMSSCEEDIDEGTVWADPEFIRITALKENLQDPESDEEVELNWAAGDTLRLFDTDFNEVPIANNEDKSNVFFSYEWNAAEPLYAVYPKSDEVGFSAGTVSFNVPSMRVVSERESVASMPSIGKVTGNKTAYRLNPMKNTLAVLRLSLTDSTASSVTIESIGGEPLAGNVTVDCARITSGEEGFLTVADDAFSSSSVVVTPAAGSDAITVAGCFKAGTYYIPIIPQTYSKGIRVMIDNTAGLATSCIVGEEEGCTAVRSGILGVGERMRVALPEELKVELVFSKLDEAGNKTGNWPFHQNRVGEDATYTYSYDYVFNGVDMTFDMDFFVYGNGDTYSLNGNGLYMAGKNSRITLPAVPERYLKSVKMEVANSAEKGLALITNTWSILYEATGATSTKPLEVVFPAGDVVTAKETPYYLRFTNAKTYIKSLTLTYSKSLYDSSSSDDPIDDGVEPPAEATGLHLFAHRGKWSMSGSDYFIPENSLTGIQMASLMGYEGIECDVKYTKDNVMVVMHDASINRTMRNADYSEISSTVNVADLTFDELRSNYVFESTEPAFRLPCPTLEEMLFECKRCGLRPMLHSSIYESYELAQEIMGDNWVCFTSQNLDNVLKVRSELKSNCTILWGIIAASQADGVETILEQIGGDCGVSAMKPFHYTPEMIAGLRERGYHVQCSIFPTEEDEISAIGNGADYVLSDRMIPEGARTDYTAEDILAAYPSEPMIRVGILGDSISTFEGSMCNPDYKEWYPKSDPNVGVAGKEDIAVNSVEKLWWRILIDEYMNNGILDANSSWSGTRVRSGVESEGYSGKKYQAGFVNRTDDFKDPDVIIIFGGTNDTTKDKGNLIGDYEWDKSINEHNTEEFRSAYVCMIKKLQASYKDVQLILVIGDKLTEVYEDSIIEIAGHFGLPYVNFVGESAKLPKCATVHPDAVGQQYIAQKIFSTCKDYLTR